MIYGSLFSGIGGFDLGFKRAGMQCAWQVEIDSKCRDILRRNLPGAEIYNDVKQCGSRNLTPVGLVCGGFPCQDLSIAGRRAGLAGERSGLWFEFHRIIAEIKPGWVVIENVPGLLSSNGGADFAVILQGLVKCGYGVAWRILDAQYFGVAQRRRRVFIVGHLGDGRAAEVLFERDCGARDTPPSKEKGTGVARSIAFGSTTNHGDESQQQYIVAHALSASKTAIGRLDPNGQDFVYGIYDEQTPKIGDDIFPTIRARESAGGFQQAVAFNIQNNDGGDHKRKDRPNGGMYVNETDTALTVGSTDMTAIAFSADRDGVNTYNEVSPTLTHKGDSKEAHGAYSKVAVAWEMSHANEAIRDNGIISPTLQQRMGTGGNQVPMVGVRRLTPTECERLQGFPDGWTDGQADSTRYRQLGNAVAVPCIEWLGGRIMGIR
jgi:DNA (cytosine-5)-methyltransferase 1